MDASWLQVLFDVEHFHQYTLSDENVRQSWILALTSWLLISFTAVTVCGANRRKLAWVISLVNSSSMMLVGIFYCTVKWAAFPNFFSFDPSNRAVVHSIDNVSVNVAIWFALANIFDIGVGLLFYREHLDPLTAYIHHSVAVWMMYASTTGDGIFTKVEPFASFFMVLMLVEIPTFLLALGAVFPSLRTDIGFGVTFFIFRLVYLVLMWYAAWRLQAGTTVMILGGGFLILHLFWFSNWIKKYGSKMFRKEMDKKKS